MRIDRVTLWATVSEGKVSYPAKMTEHIRGLVRDGRVKIVISIDAQKRSNKQNSYWWGVVIPHVLWGLKDSGQGWLDGSCQEHRQIVHEMLCDKFLDNGREIEIPGGVYRLRSSSSRANTIEFGNMLDSVRAWALEFLNIHIPEPGEI